MKQVKQEQRQVCLGCGRLFSPYKKTSFCPKCLHQQLTQRQGTMKRRHFATD